MTNEQLAALRAAALAATPQDIDKAEVIDTAQDGSRIIECPACNGDGHVTLEGDYCNYDSAAIGVQFYGIGNEHGAAERYFRATTPATMLQLLAHIDAQAARIAELEAQQVENNAYATQPPTVAVPDGYALVPTNATLDMSIAFAEVFYSKVRAIDDDNISDWWAAMLDAAPQAAVSEKYAAVDTKRYHALREAVASAASGNKHPVEVAITDAMRETYAKTGSATPDFDAIDQAIDKHIAELKAQQATTEESLTVRDDASEPATEYSWSNDGEQYHGRFDSIEEAIADYLNTHGDNTEEAVYVGKVKPYVPCKP